MATYEWQLGDEVWLQSDTGFSLKSVRGVAVPPEWTPEGLARQLGARGRAPDCAGKEAGCSALYPSGFSFCPACGKPLPDPALDRRACWLPPFGNDPGRQQKPTGLMLTDKSVLLARGTDDKARADRTLDPPPEGAKFQFLIAPLGTKVAAIIAVDLRDGLLFVRAGVGGRDWVELRSGDVSLSGWSMPASSWGIVAENLQSSNRLWLPTDHGLCAVAIDLIGLAYSAEYVSESCVGAPVALGGNVLAPCLTPSGQTALLCAPMAERADAQVAVIPIKGEFQAQPRSFFTALGTSKRVIWEADEGHVVLGVLPRGGYSAEFVPWPNGWRPWFELGAPYCDRSKELWRECRSRVGSNEVFYVKLGKGPSEHQKAEGGPRFSTGGLSFRMGVAISEKENPWVEPSADGAQLTKVVIPLVEHDSDDLAVCAEIEWTGSIDGLLSLAEKRTVRFGLRGRTHRNFLIAEVHRPWETRVFIQDGHLFLYHADIGIQGWELAS